MDEAFRGVETIVYGCIRNWHFGTSRGMFRYVRSKKFCFSCKFEIKIVYFFK